MRIAVVGSGGVGGFFGAKLVEAGHDVRFIARGRHLEAIQAHGLVVENLTDGTSNRYDIAATDDPTSIGKADLVLFAVKMWDTETAADQVLAIVGEDTAVLSLQNGVIKDLILKDRFGDSAVLGGVAYVATSIARPGVIAQTGSLQKVTIGEYDGSRSARVRELVDSFAAGGVEANAADDIERILWEKYVFLVGLSAMTTVSRLPIGVIRQVPESRALLLQIISEAVAVGRARGVALPQDYAEERLRFVDTLPEAMKASMLHDLEAGKPLELRWLSGGVSTLGREVGVATPVNDFVVGALAPLAHGPGPEV